MKIGDPLDVSTAHGPQNHKKHLDSLLKFVERGVADGATLVHGGKRVDMPGATAFALSQTASSVSPWLI